MAFDYSSAALKPGKTIPLKLYMLPGEPVVHVEHLGETNASFWNDSIAKANGGERRVGGNALTKRAIASARRKNRATLAAHAIRKLDATHSDGKAATLADIPEFVDALPDDIVDFLRDYCTNQENFRDTQIEGVPENLAGK